MFLEPWPEPLLLAAVAAAGLIVGSFANVCIHRLPLGQSVVWPASRCTRCAAPIRAWQNIPLLSYALLRGRCAGCRAPIPWRYPAVEAANGLLWLGLVQRFGLSWSTLPLLALATALLILMLIDAEHFLLPDVVTLPGVAAGLAACALPGWWLGWREAALSAAAGYAAFAAVALAYERWRGIEGLGQGDWKMAAMLGAFLGWRRLLLVVFVASVAGTLVGLGRNLRSGGDLRRELPLGTFLALAGLLALFWGDELLAWYGELWRL